MDDTPNKMLEDVVRSLGGSKAVAPKLWPEKSVLDAQKTLCDCLNDDRPAKLDFAQVQANKGEIVDRMVSGVGGLLKAVNGPA